MVFHVRTNRFSTQHNGHLHRLKLSLSICPASLSGLYFKSYSHHQNHQNFLSSTKTSKNNTVPRISQAPPYRFTPHHTCIFIGLSSLDSFNLVSLSGPYFKSYSHHQNHQNFSSSAKTSNNNTVPRISQAPPNRFTPHQTCICIGLSSLDLSN